MAPPAEKPDYSSFNNWLFKSEGASRIEKGYDFKFSIEDLEACKDQTTSWDGVRNYEARNFMKDYMKVGDEAFFYHSNVKIPGIVGLVEVTKESHPDPTQFDKKSYYYDARATVDNPKWFLVDVKLKRKLKRCISLEELKHWQKVHSMTQGPLSELRLIKRSRLSVIPISKEEWDFICSLEDQESVIDG
ncbi:thymocyte nuclear protein 1 [Galendromus occidentalis]|uniref:Thymocyte nuclear protein 1 n=1 Tax=Galendromus occidentalis TaxID=34638 RepID=A0AAJ7P9Z4_9ACAR|nr:thymocyte nuclear protein 1 [Galendromus occidentalis]